MTNNSINNYVKKLLEVNGPEDSMKILEKSLNAAKRGSSTLFYDEADFSITENGLYELAKNQSKKKTDKHNKRVKTTVNFYTEAIRVLKKGVAQ